MLRFALSRVSLLSAMVAVLAGVLVTPAGAVSRPQFVLTPTDGSSYPRFSAQPGNTVRGALRLQSQSNRAQIVRLQGLDLVTSNLGGIEFPSERATQTGAWIRLERRDVRLDPGASATVRFAVELPDRVAAGEHYAGLVAVDRGELRRASAERPADQRGVVLNQVTRVALPVRLDVPGPSERRLDLRDITFEANAGGSRLDIDLGNIGQRLIRSTAVDLRVTREGESFSRHKVTLSEFVPDTRIKYPMPLQGKPARGEYRVTGTIRPDGAPAIQVDRRVAFRGPQVERLAVQTGDATPGKDLPVLLIGALGIAIVLAVSASVGYVRLRRRLAEATK